MAQSEPSSRNAFETDGEPEAVPAARRRLAFAIVLAPSPVIARTMYGRLPRGKGSLWFWQLVGRGHVYGV